MIKNRNIDNNSMIGLFLIFVILTIFYYSNLHDEYNKKKFIKSHAHVYNNTNTSIYPIVNNNKKYKNKKYFIIENNVLRFKISNIGGMIEDVLLKKYKSYNSTSDLNYYKNLFISKDFSFQNKIIFFRKNNNLDEFVDTKKLYFVPFLINDKRIILKTINPYYKKGIIYYIYDINNKNGYDINFSIISKNMELYKYKNICIQQNIFSIEKDRNWENSYTKLYYSFNDNNNTSIDNFSEKKTEYKNINNVNWIANKQQFFTTIIIPLKTLNNVFIKSENFSYGKILKKINIFCSDNSKKNMNVTFKFYFGPLDINLLNYYNNEFEDIIPFGWGFLKFINKYFFLKIFQFLEKTNLNYGVIIILMTLVVKVILLPITYKQYELSYYMKLLKPEIEKINNKYKNEKDLVKKQMAMIDLYKKSGINPLSGCLSIILQIPIFYSLFKFFPTLINLRGKSFLWVDDLTSYDSIYDFSFNIPFYGNHISLLTLLYSFVLFLYTKISGNDRNSFRQSDDMYNNSNFILYLMPFIMLLFINSYASALSLYYFVSNIINIIFFFIIKINFLNKNIIKN